MIYSRKFNKFKGIKHCFFSRKGGYSSGVYKGLNCGRGSKDVKKNVLKNLKYVAKKMLIEQNNLVLMYQTHSNKVIRINKKNFRKKIHSDAIITSEKGLVLGVVTADCVPILIYDKQNKIIGCIHAGWKGALNGIIENTISKIKKLNKKNKIYASIGPCIGRENYEVGFDFFRKFIKKSKIYKKYFIKKNEFKKLFDLRKFVSNKLLKQTVIIDQINRDTFKDSNNFFSYRRSSILKERDYGRCISVIKLT